MRAADAVQACIIGTAAIGLTAIAEVAFAQSAADPAVIERLQAVIQQQQRQLEEQRRQMEEQQRVLESLQQQVQQIERAAAEAQQAASAARAEVDAEVAAGPSAEPVVTSGQPEVELSISGQINRAVNILGDGDGTEVMFVDNDVSNSRIRFVGTARATDDLTLATNIELGISPNNSSDVSQDNEDAGDFFDERKVEVYADHTALGRLWLGKGSTASDDTAEYDLSGVDVIMYSGVADIVGAVQFRQDDGGDLSGIRVDEAFFNFDGLGREDRARYDTPVFGPGLQLSTSFASDERYDAALTLGGDFGNWSGVDIGDFTTLAAIAVSDPNIDGVDYRLNGSASFLHNPTGLNLTLSSGFDQADGANPNNQYVKLGRIAQLNRFGDTAFGVDFTRSENQPTSSDKAFSVGGAIVQNVSDFGIDLYTQVRWFTLDRDADPDVDDIIVGTLGSRVKF